MPAEVALSRALGEHWGLRQPRRHAPLRKRYVHAARRVHAPRAVEVAELEAAVVYLRYLPGYLVLKVRRLVDVAADGAVLADIEDTAYLAARMRGGRGLPVATPDAGGSVV